MSAGRGPQECSWAVAELARRLEADAGRHGVAVSRVETAVGPGPGTFKSVLFRLHGAGAESFAALRMIRERLEQGDAAAGQALTTARWRIHDDLVRGDPVRTERP
jgi:hypothetical protein